MNTSTPRPATLREIELAVEVEGREWARPRLQAEADRHGEVSPGAASGWCIGGGRCNYAPPWGGTLQVLRWWSAGGGSRRSWATACTGKPCARAWAGRKPTWWGPRARCGWNRAVTNCCTGGSHGCWPIGSGAVESACRQRQGRFKRSGQFWTPAGMRHLSALTEARHTHHWDELWWQPDRGQCQVALRRFFDVANLIAPRCLPR